MLWEANGADNFAVQLSSKTEKSTFHILHCLTVGPFNVCPNQPPFRNYCTALLWSHRVTSSARSLLQATDISIVTLPVKAFKIKSLTNNGCTCALWPPEDAVWSWFKPSSIGAGDNCENYELLNELKEQLRKKMKLSNDCRGLNIVGIVIVSPAVLLLKRIHEVNTAQNKTTQHFRLLLIFVILPQ